MGRGDAPADVQWARAFIAVIVGLVLSCQVLRPAAPLPDAAAIPAELRALAVLPCLVMYVVLGE